MTTRRSPSHIVPRAFPGIRPSEVEELITYSKTVKYPAGTVLCHEDTIETTFYMLLEGEVQVTKRINKSEDRSLKMLYAGDFFGEMGLIHNAPRAATVRATTDVIVLELEKDAFDRVLKNSSSVSLAMVREISNRLRQNDEMAVEDLRLRAGELAQAYQKLAEEELKRREFLTNVAHELRTPLMAASGFLQLIEKGMITEPMMPEAIAKVARNVDDIVTLVNDILFLQELDLVLEDFQPVKMDEIAKSVIGKYQQKAIERGINLKINVGPALPAVSGDRKSLERALISLVDNAIKFSPNGGDVEIRLSHQDGRVFVAVQDHGIGMIPETRKRIFDRFYHLERSGDNLFGGIGLGLAITRQVIQQHHGSLDVESESRKGSTFTMALREWTQPL
jgi:signal transduction histidine kinase